MPDEIDVGQLRATVSIDISQAQSAAREYIQLMQQMQQAAAQMEQAQSGGGAQASAAAQNVMAEAINRAATEAKTASEAHAQLEEHLVAGGVAAQNTGRAHAALSQVLSTSGQQAGQFAGQIALAAQGASSSAQAHQNLTNILGQSGTTAQQAGQAHAALAQHLAASGQAAGQAGQGHQQLAQSMGRVQSIGTSLISNIEAISVAYLAVRRAAQDVGAVAAGAFERTVGASAEYQRTMQTLQANTNLTDQQTKQLSGDILQMGSSSAAPLGQLAQGYRVIRDEGFGAASSTQILNVAQQAAVATGGSVTDFARSGALALHNYGAGAADATQYLNLLFRAAQLGNTTIEQFATSTGRATAFAATLGISFKDVEAALSALTRSFGNADDANTAMVNIMSHLVNPTKQVQDEIKLLAQVTGVDLTNSFSLAAVQSKGLVGVIDDIRKATAGHDDALIKLMPNLRGTIGFLALATTANADYKTAIQQLTAIQQGANPIAEAYGNAQKTAAVQFEELKNQVQVLGITIGSTFLPAAEQVVQDASQITRAVQIWYANNKQLADHLAGDALAAVHAIASGIELMTGIALGAAEGFLRLLLAVGQAEEGFGRFIGVIPGMKGVGDAIEEDGKRTTNFASSAIHDIDLVRQAWNQLQQTVTGAAPAAANAIQEAARAVAAAQEKVGRPPTPPAGDSLPSLQQYTQAEKDATTAQELETRATVAGIEGHAREAELLHQAAAAYAVHNDALGKSLEEQAKIAEAEDQAAKQAAEAAQQRVRDETAAGDAIDKAQQQITDITAKNDELLSGSYLKKHEASQQSIADERAQGAAAQSGAEQAFAAWQGYTAQYIAAEQNRIAALQAGDDAGAKYWENEASRSQTLAGTAKDSFDKQLQAAEGFYKQAGTDSDELARKQEENAQKAADTTRSAVDAAIAGHRGIATALQAEAAAQASGDAAAVASAHARTDEAQATQKLADARQQLLSLPTGKEVNLDTELDQRKRINDEIEASVGKERDRLEALGRERSVLQDQLDLLNDQLAAEGKTNETDPVLAQLRLARDSAELNGQSTTDLDKQIRQRELLNQVAQDQVNVQTTGIRQQEAANKIEQDRAKSAIDTATAHEQSTGALQSQLTVLQEIDKLERDRLQRTREQAAADLQVAQALGGGTGAGGPNTIAVPGMPTPAQIQQQAQPVGSAVALGIAAGITQSAPSIQAAARQAIDAALQAAKQEAGIASPSTRAAAEIGLPLAQGAAIGILAGAGLMADAMASGTAAALSLRPVPLLSAGTLAPVFTAPVPTPVAASTSGGSGSGDFTIGKLLHVENMTVRNDGDIQRVGQVTAQALYAAEAARRRALGYPNNDSSGPQL